MTDRTNAPYDPAAAETSHEWAERVGQEHDTWHRPDDGGTPPAGLTLTSLTPSTIVERSHDPITIIGTGFNPLSVVWQGVTTYPTTPISETELTFDSHGIRDGVRPIKVKSTGSDVYSNELPLTVTDVPTPTITSITPDTFSLAAGPIPAVIVGTNFVDGAIIDGKAAPSIPFTQPTTFVSPTELHANFDPAGMGIGQGLVAIRNPDEGVSSNIAYYVEA